MKRFNRIAIVGVGLIGGSIGLSARKKNLAREVVGICRREVSRKAALRSGACDRATLNMREGLEGSDLVIIATPIGGIVQAARKIISLTKHKMIITDVGSTKEEIVRGIERIIPERVRFVGAHPMAGSEKHGVGAAEENLFERSICILTKTDKTDTNAFNTVKKFWQALGAECRPLDPRTHDNLISYVSHLPHASACSLTVTARPESLAFASTGFKDTTRIASSEPGLWLDIFKTNKKAVLSAMEEFKSNFDRVEGALRKNDFARLARILKKAKKIRDSLIK